MKFCIINDLNSFVVFTWYNKTLVTLKSIHRKAVMNFWEIFDMDINVFILFDNTRTNIFGIVLYANFIFIN